MRKQMKNHSSSLYFINQFCREIIRTVDEGGGIVYYKPVSVPGRKRQKQLDIVKQESKIECKL